MTTLATLLVACAKTIFLVLAFVMPLASVLTWAERRQSAMIQDRLGPNRANIGPIREWGLEIVDGGIAIDTTTATNVPGVYAAGDVTRYRGKLNLIATGFGAAAIAANYCKSVVDPESRVFPGHSSEKSAP